MLHAGLSLTQRDPPGKLARWALTIQEMDLTILHRSGKKNVNADALSRNPAAAVDGTADVYSVEAEEDPLLKQFDQSMSEIRKFQQEDPDLVEYFEYAFPGRWCIVVPKSVRPTLLEEAHAGHFAEHLSERKIYDRLRRSYYWHGMRSDVRRYCRSCLTCASRKGNGRRVHPPLQPIPVGGHLEAASNHKWKSLRSSIH